MLNSVYSVVSLKSFSVFSEYFIALSAIYMLIVVTLIAYSSYGLLLQKGLSECVALILFMSCYLMLNDDLIAFNFLSFNNSIVNDYFSFLTKFLICFFSAIYFLLNSDSLKNQNLTAFEYIIIILLSILGLMLMCSSNDLLLAYLSIELSSLAFYLLASFKKTSSYSIESGIKYFITGAISSALFLLGSSFIYAIGGSINFNDFYDLFGSSFFYTFPFRFVEWESPVLYSYYLILEDLGYFNLPELFSFGFLEIGLALILFSLFIKLALAPFHLWSLDVYEGSPTSSTVFFAVISKLSVFVILIRLCYISFFSMKGCWQSYLMWVGVLSVFVGSIGGLKQRKLKTLIAYSSTSHMGYALLAISSATYLGIQMLLFYMVVYMISGLCLWSIVLFLQVKRKASYSKYSKELGDFVFLNKSNSLLAISLSLAMFSIAGIPPLIGFIAKLSVFLPLINNFSYFPALASILLSAISTFYYIRVVKVLYSENLIVGNLYYSIKAEKTLLLSLLVFSLVFIFVNPTLLHLVCHKTILLLI